MITIYGNSRCSWCEKAKTLAIRQGLLFDYRNVDSDEILNELKLKLPGAKTIPQIYWDDIYLGGYNEFATEIKVRAVK